MTLPDGFSINANAVDGKTACTNEQANVGIRDLPAECPRIPRWARFRSRARRYRARSRALSISESQSREIDIDFSSSRMALAFTSSFPDRPIWSQILGASLFLSRISRSFHSRISTSTSSARSEAFWPLPNAAAPTRSTALSRRGTVLFPTRARNSFSRSTAVQTGGPCPGPSLPFDPSFRAGVVDKTAGVHAPFSLEVGRNDGDQNLTGLTVTSPPGFSASLRGVPYCPESAMSQLADPAHSGHSRGSSRRRAHRRARWER